MPKRDKKDKKSKKMKSNQGLLDLKRKMIDLEEIYAGVDERTVSGQQMQVMQRDKTLSTANQQAQFKQEMQQEAQFEQEMQRDKTLSTANQQAQFEREMQQYEDQERGSFWGNKVNQQAGLIDQEGGSFWGNKANLEAGSIDQEGGSFWGNTVNQIDNAMSRQMEEGKQVLQDAKKEAQSKFGQWLSQGMKEGRAEAYMTWIKSSTQGYGRDGDGLDFTVFPDQAKTRGDR